MPPDFEGPDKAERLLEAVSRWPIHAALVRRRVFEAAGGFHTYLGTVMDYEFWLRTALAWPIVRVDAVLAYYRHHEEGQITATQWRQAVNTWEVKRRFVREHPELVRHLPRERLRSLIDGGLLKRGYDLYWRRDLVSAQKVFRTTLRAGGWTPRDLKYLLPALLPPALYRRLVGERAS